MNFRGSTGYGRKFWEASFKQWGKTMQDDISDAYYPFGRNNMAEVAFLASHLLWMQKRHEIETLHEMITTRAASAMNLSDYGLTAGCKANLIVHDYPDVTEALRFHAPPRHVLSHGRPVDLARMRQLAQG